jgi:hypothetical protein
VPNKPQALKPLSYPTVKLCPDPPSQTPSPKPHSISAVNGHFKPSRPRLIPVRPKVCTRHVRKPLRFPQKLETAGGRAGLTFLKNATVRGRDWYNLLDAPVLTLDVTVRGDHFRWESHLQTLIIHELAGNQNYYTSTLMLLSNIVLCG